MSKATESRIAVSHDTRKRLKAAKRGGDTYNDVIQKMVDQYDPDADHDRRND